MNKLMAVILLTALMLSGCGPNEATKARKAGSETKKDVEIIMWLIGSEAQAKTIKELAEDFHAKTGVRVKCDAISWGDAHSKYLTSIAGGVAPDIATMGLTWGSEFGNLGSMVDLKAAYPAEVEEMKASIFPGLWNSIQAGDKIYGIPFDMSECVLYYRNDIIAKPPQTWEELADLLTELGKSNKGMIFDWGSLNWIGYSPFLWQAGGDYYNSDHTQVTVNSPEAVSAMKFFSELYTKYNVPKTKIPLEQGIRTGDFPIAISGNWMIDRLRLSAPEIAGKFSIATMPKGPTGKMTAFIGGRIIGIFEQSRNKEAAWEFIKYLSTPEVQKKLYEASQSEQDTYLPPSTKTWDILSMDPKFKEVLVNQANDAKGPPPVTQWDTCARYVDEAIQRVVLQGADAQAELDKSKSELERILTQK